MRPADPEPITGISWRALSAADVPALHALARAVEVADDMPFVSTLDEIAQWLGAPELDLSTDSIGGWLDDGTLACFGIARARSGARRRRGISQDGHVHPAWRRRGLGNAVIAWTEQRGRAIAAAAGDTVPSFLELWCDARADDRHALFTRRGYETIRYYDEMRRPLADELPDAPLPDGLSLLRWQPEHDARFREAHNTAFEDHWGSEPLSAEQWRHQFTGSPNFRADLTVGAQTADGQFVGYVIGYHAPADAAATGRLEGWLGQVGTLREWRGRGVASALMVQVMREMQRAGLDYALLDVDSENPTGAVGLYERLGFRPVHRWLRWAKPA